MFFWVFRVLIILLERVEFVYLWVREFSGRGVVVVCRYLEVKYRRYLETKVDEMGFRG